MKIRYITYLVSFLILTACAGTHNPSGPRVRMVNGVNFSNSGDPVSYGYGQQGVQSEEDFLSSSQTHAMNQGYSQGMASGQSSQKPPLYHQAPDQYPSQQPTQQPNQMAGSYQDGSFNPYTPTETSQPSQIVQPVQPTQTTQGNVAAQTTSPASSPNSSASAGTPSTSSQSVDALLAEANQAVNNNDLTKAASLLNRAARIEPTNESIWYDLAQISLHQKEYAKAEQLANKSIAFAGSNKSLVSKNWEIIALSREARHDFPGAEAARNNM